jgi:hypothetical protein
LGAFTEQDATYATASFAASSKIHDVIDLAVRALVRTLILKVEKALIGYENRLGVIHNAIR